MTDRLPQVLVVGCGAIGATIAVHLARAQECGLEVLARNVSERESRALRLRDGAEDIEAEATFVGEALLGRYDYVLLCTRPPQVEAATRSIQSALSPNGRVVVLQNGLCEARVAAIVSAENVIGGIVSFGASASAAGDFERTSRGGFVLGGVTAGVNPIEDASLGRLKELLSPIGEVSLTHNLAGARWSKLAINAAISSLGTIGGDTLGRLMRRRVVRRLALEIMSEVTEVARAEGVALEKVAGTLDLPWLALSDRDRRGSLGMIAKHSVLFVVGLKYRHLRSSMLRAIERGRAPGVEFLNGEIVTRGEAHGIATPYNLAAQEFVLAIAKGERQSSAASIDALASRAEVLRAARLRVLQRPAKRSGAAR